MIPPKTRTSESCGTSSTLPGDSAGPARLELGVRRNFDEQALAPSRIKVDLGDALGTLPADLADTAWAKVIVLDTVPRREG